MKRIRSLATLVVLVSIVPTVHAAPMTLEDVGSLKQVTTVRMSPAADRIAYLLQVPREIYKDLDGSAYHELHVADRRPRWQLEALRNG
jgi:hypothetical protein